jgi:hypothetical protein
MQARAASREFASGESATAIVKPTAAPSARSTADSFAVKSEACQRICSSHRPFTCAGRKSACTILCRCGIGDVVDRERPRQAEVGAHPVPALPETREGGEGDDELRTTTEKALSAQSISRL